MDAKRALSVFRSACDVCLLGSIKETGDSTNKVCPVVGDSLRGTAACNRRLHGEYILAMGIDN